MDYIISIDDPSPDVPGDIYWRDQRPGTIVQHFTAEGQPKWSHVAGSGACPVGRWECPDLPNRKITVSEWYPCPDHGCVSDIHDGKQHVANSGHSFTGLDYGGMPDDMRAEWIARCPELTRDSFALIDGGWTIDGMEPDEWIDAMEME